MVRTSNTTYDPALFPEEEFDELFRRLQFYLEKPIADASILEVGSPRDQSYQQSENYSSERYRSKKYGCQILSIKELRSLSDPSSLISSETKHDACILYNLSSAQDPNLTLQLVRSLLSEKGVLIVRTPSTDSRKAKLTGAKWPAFQDLHPHYFNSQNLEMLLIKNGFTDTHSLRSNGMVSSSITCFSRKTRDVRKLPRLSLIVPVYNEVNTFRESFETLLAKKIDGVETEFVIVESNSTDGTRDVVKKYQHLPNIQIVWEDRPRGKGYAVRTGLEAATGDIIGIQDADLEYDVNDYDKLVMPIINHERMFILGSRHNGSWKMREFQSQKLMSGFLNFGHVLFTFLINIACRTRMRDPFTMYKLFRKECLFGLEFSANRFDFDVELVLKLINKRYFPREIPVNYISRSFEDGKKVSMWRDPLLWIRAIIKYRILGHGMTFENLEKRVK